MSLLLWICIAVFTTFSACGLLGSDDGGLLTVTPVSAVEVLLKVNAQPGADIAVTRDGAEIFSFTMEGSDTLLTDTGLTPNTSYRWLARRLTGRRQTAARQATTLDTTSHIFTWQKFEFGEYSSSSIKDVAIIDENNIWAVGEIYMNDSTGNPDFTPYNAVHWDGNEWEMKRITVNFRGNEVTASLSGIQVFSATDIWVAGSLPIHGNGSNWEVFDVRRTVSEELSLWNMWGKSTGDIYFIGHKGSIAHYNGENWQKLESGTTLNVNDIWGSRNPRTGKWEILATASMPFSTADRKLLSLSADGVTVENAMDLDPAMNAVWFEAGGRYFIGGNDLFYASDPGGPWVIEERFQPGFRGSKAAVRGNGLNDIVVVGTYGLVMHFNGAGWQHYDEQMLLDPAGAYSSLDVANNIIAAGGGQAGKGIVLIGRRE